MYSYDVYVIIKAKLLLSLLGLNTDRARLRVYVLKVKKLFSDSD